MFVTPAYAQSFGGGSDLVVSLLPFILIFVIMYFLIIRPQRKAAKTREAMLGAVRRNDSIVTGGGLVGKVTKVIDDNELEVEISKDVKVRVMRAMIADVRVKGEAAKS
ncbi:MAG: preprotein translocase subunit YajC [Rhizobiaceae bacterium]|nr:preprotein translocase subunit YajC [Rhizobiaceae bacterium]